MTTFISDFVVGVKAIKAARGMRKRGATGIEIVPIKAIPIVNIGYWSWTPEACLAFPKVPEGTREAVKAVFQSFDEDTQHTLTFTPDYFPERVRFWQRHLKPDLTPEQYSAAILTIIQWCREAVQYRLDIGPNPVSIWD